MTSVLFITGVESAPYRYRVSNLLEQLAILGVPASARHHHDQDALQLVAEHEIVIFQRVPWDDYVSRLVGRARAAGALPVFGIDDLLFEPERPPPLLSTMSRDEASAWMDSVRAFRQVFDACDAFLGSTETLARAAEGLGKKAFVHRNTLSRELIAISEAARSARQPSREVRLGYFSGTRTHTRDFREIAPVLARVLDARPTARLLVTGPLELPRELERFRLRTGRLPIAPWRQLPSLLVQADVNLAPLELDERFCHAKSELKWFEAAAAGVPTIASPTEPFRFAIRDGETGFLAQSPQEWEEKLLRMIDDAPLREHIAKAAHDDAIARYGPEASAQKLGATLRELDALRPRRELRPVRKVTAADVAMLKAGGLAIGKAAIEPQGALPGPEQLATRLATPAINGGTSAQQVFTCGPGRLYRIDVLVGAHARVNSHDIDLRLLDAKTQELLATATSDAAEACDNAWFSFEFAPVEIGSERELVFVVEAPLAPPNQGLSLWYEPSPAGRGRCANLDGLDFAFRSWLRPPSWQPHPAPKEQAPSGDALVERLRELELRVKRAEERAATALAEAASVRRQLETAAVALLRVDKLRGTLPYKAARKVYRWLKK